LSGVPPGMDTVFAWSFGLAREPWSRKGRGEQPSRWPGARPPGV